MMPIPREGIHLGYVGSVLAQVFLGFPALAVYTALAIAQLLTPQGTSEILPHWLPGPTSLCLAIGTIILLKLQTAAGESSINNGISPTPLNFDREIALVTGGSSGIGESIIKFILETSQAAQIVIVDIVPPARTVAERVHYYPCDLSDRLQIEAVVAKIKSEVGDPTILVNNAGLSRGRNLSETHWTDVTATLNVNLLAPFLLVRAFLPAMIANDHGHIVNISSMSAFVPPAGLADYGASKAGLLAMTESLRSELRHIHRAKRVRVSAFVLSFVRTPLFKGKTNQSNFVSPLLHVDTCGQGIFKAIAQNRSVVTFMPGMLGFMAGIAGFPRWLHDSILDSTIKLDVDFKGRQKIDANGAITG